MTRNALAAAQRLAALAARTLLADPESMTAPAPGASSTGSAGHNDAGTGAWLAAGVTGITSTGDPFYSAAS